MKNDAVSYHVVDKDGKACIIIDGSGAIISDIDFDEESENFTVNYKLSEDHELPENIDNFEMKLSLAITDLIERIANDENR